MSSSLAQLKRCRHWFTRAFTASFIVLLVSSLFSSFYVESHSEQLSMAIVISVTSLLTSAASLAGLFLVFYIALHKEHRAQQGTGLEIEKKNLC